MVKIVVVDTLGILIAEIEEGEGELVLSRPLAFAPSQTGIALQENPLYGQNLRVNRAYVIAQSDPSETMKSQYDAYALKKRTGLVTPDSEMRNTSKLKF